MILIKLNKLQRLLAKVGVDKKAISLIGDKAIKKANNGQLQPDASPGKILTASFNWKDEQALKEYDWPVLYEKIRRIIYLEKSRNKKLEERAFFVCNYCDKETEPKREEIYIENTFSHYIFRCQNCGAQIDLEECMDKEEEV